MEQAGAARLEANNKEAHARAGELEQQLGQKSKTVKWQKRRIHLLLQEVGSFTLTEPVEYSGQLESNWPPSAPFPEHTCPVRRHGRRISHVLQIPYADLQQGSWHWDSLLIPKTVSILHLRCYHYHSWA